MNLIERSLFYSLLYTAAHDDGGVLLLLLFVERVLFVWCAGVDASLQIEHRIPSQVTSAGPKHNKPRVTNSRDERFRSGMSVSFTHEHFFCLLVFSRFHLSDLRSAH